MSRYRRSGEAGGTYFFTLVTLRRRRIFDDEAAPRHLHDAIAAAGRNRTFELLQCVLLPDHLHLIVRLPSGDADFSTRVAAIKSSFTRSWLAAGGSEAVGSASRVRQRYRGVWQKRFWEHTVRDEGNLACCSAYVWFNPVKHGLASCPHAWPWSSFHQEAREGGMPEDWCCVCDGANAADTPKDIPGAEGDVE